MKDCDVIVKVTQDSLMHLDLEKYKEHSILKQSFFFLPKMLSLFNLSCCLNIMCRRQQVGLLYYLTGPINLGIGIRFCCSKYSFLSPSGEHCLDPDTHLQDLYNSNPGGEWVIRLKPHSRLVWILRSDTSPWILTATQGQHYNITLTDGGQTLAGLELSLWKHCSQHI